MYCFCHAASVDAVPQRVSWRVQLFLSCVRKLNAPVLPPQESSYFTLAPSKLTLIPFIRLQQSHSSVHGTCTLSSLHSFTFKLLSFLLAYSEVSLLPVCILYSSVAPFLHLRGSHLFISTLLSSSPILHSSRVLCHHSFSFLHVPIFFNLVKILLALIHALLNMVIHSWILWRFCLPSFMLF